MLNFFIRPTIWQFCYTMLDVYQLPDHVYPPSLLFIYLVVLKVVHHVRIQLINIIQISLEQYVP